MTDSAHRGRQGVLWPLNESNAAVLLNLPEPVGPVAASTTKNDPDDALSVDFDGGYEQGVCRRTSVVDFRSLIQSDAARHQKHLMIRRSYTSPLPSKHFLRFLDRNHQVAKSAAKRLILC
jgi:hypothetical protein